MADLIIDIGNTALRAAWADGITLGRTYRYQGERILDYIIYLISERRPEKIVLSNSGKLSTNDIGTLKGNCERLIIVDNSVNALYDIPDYITADRTAAIVASRYLFKGRKCTIFDFGTTLSIDFIDENGLYEGGYISPGCRTRFRSINRYSRYLPLLDITDETEEKCKDLSSSITSGVVKGIIFEIEGYLRIHPENIIVFTGGDAIYFAKRMKNSIFVVCNLVLMGLALIALEYDKKD
ncbi:MAG: type III pantothenate kinase [Bacteroidales bacterium]|nr:type III pantothenate kinase [Bacteroidales bacterium]